MRDYYLVGTVSGGEDNILRWIVFALNNIFNSN